MHIGVPTEIKSQENRVGLNPASVLELVAAGHRVTVQSNAGAGIFASDDAYIASGADIVPDADSVFAQADMIVKVKEPQPVECKKLKENQILFTYLHLAPDPVQARGLMDSGCTAIAYETIKGCRGDLPLLAPMSEVAGRMAPIMGATYGGRHFGARGKLISGVPGVEPSKVLIIGGGVSGFNAARLAVGMGADVTILEMNPARIRYLDEFFGAKARILKSTQANLEKYVFDADLVIGAVLIPGGSAPKLITRGMVEQMKQGAVIVDIAIDQGGCVETSRATTHQEPIYEIGGVIHYCVANMPGAYPGTSTAALNNATLPYVLEIANHGWEKALAADTGFGEGLNVHAGKIMHPAVAKALGFDS